jgi:hypothetical protein
MTLYILAEQIRKAVVGAQPGLAAKLKIDDFKRAACQAINKLLKVEQFSTIMPNGEMIPEGSVIASYDEVAVTTYKNVARCILPALPVRLPRNMGVWHISRCDDIHCPFIPVQNGQIAMAQAEPLINDGLGIPMYEVFGNEVIFNIDVTDAAELDPIVEEVFIRLVVADVSTLGDFDVLPIPADMESDVIMAAAQLLGVTPAPDKVTDPTTDQQQPK